MLTGRRLFSGDNELAVLEHVQRCQVPPPSSFEPRVGAQLDALVASALQRDPAARLCSAAEMGRGLERVLATQAGVDRGTLLASLVRDLIGQDVPRKDGTAVLELPNGDKPASDPGSVQPVGPEVQTQPEALASFAAGKGPGAAWHRILPWGLASGVLAILGAGALTAWMLRPADRAGEDAFLESAGPSLDAIFPDAGLDADDGDGGPSAASGFPIVDREAIPGGSDRDGSIASDTMSSPPDGTSASLATRGWLYLNVIPWAKVYLGKRLLGETPLEGVALPAGEYTLTLANPALGKSRALPVKILPRQAFRRTIDLTQDP
jgi:serine/threonine-protein kinase